MYIILIRKLVSFGFKLGPTQLQKIARGLKFQTKEVERLQYLRSEIKGAYKLHTNRAADLRLCLCF